MTTRVLQSAPRPLGRLTSPLLLAVAFASLSQSGVAEEVAERWNPQSQTVLFVGDSITYNGGYIEIVDAALRLANAAAPATAPNVINIGLGSETVCGMTEPGHPFPRPNVQGRLQRALNAIQPDHVVACYGMNDGIYQPYSPSREQCYQNGMLRLVRDVLASGATLTVLTPPPFDAVGRAASGKPLATAEESLAGGGLFEGYDEVLRRYAEFVESLPQRPEFAAAAAAGQLTTVDIRTPMIEATETLRAEQPQATFTPDGIHPTPEGHAVMADAFLQAKGLGEFASAVEEAAAVRTLSRSRLRRLRDAWLTEIGHDHPRIKPGPPLATAQQEAAAIDDSLRSAVEAWTADRTEQRQDEAAESNAR